jgi:hypothetical protein
VEAPSEYPRPPEGCGGIVEKKVTLREVAYFPEMISAGEAWQC